MDTTGAMTLSDSNVAARLDGQQAIEFNAPSRAGAVSRIRARVRRFARSISFTPDDLDDICIAVGEASTNALKHGHSSNQPTIGVRMEKSETALKVFISDAGPGFDPSKVCPPCDGDLCECGRGIMCMRALMDEVHFEALNPGTRVELVKYARANRTPD